MTYCKYWMRCVPHTYSVGFCCNVEHFNLFLFVRQLYSKLLMTQFIITVSDINMSNLQWICLFLGGTKFISLTDYDMLQLLIVLCLNFLTKQTIYFTKTMRQSQVGSWSWNETHLKIHKTAIIDTDVNLHHQVARWTSSELVMFSQREDVKYYVHSYTLNGWLIIGTFVLYSCWFCCAI